jgi:oligoribonuclease NrnB/cAMP/cGMP phosphodiesterase (DHH superfamily)
MKIFHHVDNDGNLSAAIVKRKHPHAICVPYNYNGQFPWHLIDKNEEIFIVDLSLKNKQLLKDILKRTKNITWIDHHISSKENSTSDVKGIRVDAKPAACILCWEYLFQDEPMPEFISFINDYDTWAHQFGEKTTLFNLAMLSNSVDQWVDLLNDPLTPRMIYEKVKEGRIISKYLRKYYQTLAKEVIFSTTFHGHKTAVCNAFGMGTNSLKYWDQPAEIKSTFHFDGTFYHVNLYSETVNCAEIAEQYGGGGHRGAAGFRSLEFPFKDEEKFGVYKIETVPEGKVYVGSTTDSFRKQFLRHRKSLKNRRHENSALQKCWEGSEEKNFRFDIIEICKDKTMVEDREKFWIGHYLKKGKAVCLNS